MLTGYNLPHLAKFTERELNALAEILPKGLTYRIYGGNESRNYETTVIQREFLRKVEAKIIHVFTWEAARQFWSDHAILKASFESYQIQYENEQYIFNAPNFWTDRRGWWKYVTNKGGYYRDRAKADLETFTQWRRAPLVQQCAPVYISLPLNVNQNIGYKEYAKVFYNSGIEFKTDVHIYGNDPAQTAANLRWHKDQGAGEMSAFEFYGLKNTRQAAKDKNGGYHKSRTADLFRVCQPYLTEILHFTLAANQKAMKWQNPPFLHRYYVPPSGLQGPIIDELNHVY